MSESHSYKASFQLPKNEYLKYFCENPASEWTFKKFKKNFKQLKKNPEALYKKQLFVIKEHSKGIPPSVLLDINRQLNESSNMTPAPSIRKVTNYYDINKVQGDFIINQNQEPTKKKQKTRYAEQRPSGSPFNETWYSFISDAESSKNLHKYSPEKNGVLRSAHKIATRPTMDNCSSELENFICRLTNNASADLEENIEDIANLKENKAECRFIKNIFSTMLHVNKKLPSMSYSEAVFNNSLLYPCLFATSKFLSGSSELEPYFIPGEEPLRAMTEQLTIISSRVIDHRKSYNADGIIRLRSLYDLEILLLETSGCFENKCERKISFDNIKGMFGLLAMTKTVADKFSYASVELFKKLKIYFVQASDVYIRLWSIQYISNGTFRFNREDKIVVMEDRSELEKVLTSLLNFFYHVQLCLAETSNLLQQLKDQDEENKNLNKDNNSQQNLLSDIICPKLFRLTYNKDGKGFGTQPINSSPDSD